MKSHNRIPAAWIVALVWGGTALVARNAWADVTAEEVKPADAFFAHFHPHKAPPPAKECLLKVGDRLAICGDSITEQKMYSRIIETYLTACRPELKIGVRQHGWSGETAEGFLRRMKADCLRFSPTVATTCYGMNDYRYRPYEEAIDRAYRERYTAVARTFKEAGVRVVLGSPGCVGKVASWVKPQLGTLEEHNLHLCRLRDVDIDIAAHEGLRFADVFWPMFTRGYAAQQKYGANYALPGHDGVHPGWAGHLVMAYAFLKAMGLDGDLGVITVDLQKAAVTATGGHKVASFQNGAVTIDSTRYPFCGGGEASNDSSLRSGMALVPFNADLNCLTLVVRGGTAKQFRVTWGRATKTYTAEQLVRGVNLADDFVENPFCAAFKKVDDAVAAKQVFETQEMKGILHGKPEGREAAVAKAEADRAALVAKIQAALTPVTHTIRIEP